MPARKPSALINRHETAAEKRAREVKEAALRPEKGLPVDAPTRLAGHPIAEKTWRRMARLFNEIEGEIVTRLDMDLLIDYCILIEQVGELDQMRTSTKLALEHYSKAEQDALKKGEIIDALTLTKTVTDHLELIVKLDSRVDRKRALVLQLRQSLYLTPRARAGAAPTPKEPPEQPDALEQLLDEAYEVIDGNGKQ